MVSLCGVTAGRSSSCSSPLTAQNGSDLCWAKMTRTRPFIQTSIFFRSCFVYLPSPPTSIARNIVLSLLYAQKWQEIQSWRCASSALRQSCSFSCAQISEGAHLHLNGWFGCPQTTLKAAIGQLLAGAQKDYSKSHMRFHSQCWVGHNLPSYHLPLYSLTPMQQEKKTVATIVCFICIVGLELPYKLLVRGGGLLSDY